MIIRFSAHALQRCEEQDLRPAYIRRELETKPPQFGVRTWHTELGHRIVFEQRVDFIAVITVIHCRKIRQRKWYQQGRRKSGRF